MRKDNQLKKGTMIAIIVIILLLSGCEKNTLGPNEKSLPNGIIVTGNINKVDVLECSIGTYRYITTISSIETTKIGDGFLHLNIIENGQNINYFYIINGTVKNIYNQKVEALKIIIKFYDENNILLETSDDILSLFGLTTITNLPSGYSKTFSITIYPYSTELTKYYDHVSLEIVVW